jgi:hypothetical protein
VCLLERGEGARPPPPAGHQGSPAAPPSRTCATSGVAHPAGTSTAGWSQPWRARLALPHGPQAVAGPAPRSGAPQLESPQEFLQPRGQRQTSPVGDPRSPCISDSAVGRPPAVRGPQVRPPGAPPLRPGARPCPVGPAPRTRGGARPLARDARTYRPRSSSLRAPPPLAVSARCPLVRPRPGHSRIQRPAGLAGTRTQGTLPGTARARPSSGKGGAARPEAALDTGHAQ